MADVINLGKYNDYKRPQNKNKKILIVTKKKVCLVFDIQMTNTTHSLLQRSTIKKKS